MSEHSLDAQGTSNLAALMNVDLTMKNLSAALVAELALGVSSKKDILARHGVSEDEWEVLRQVPAFRTMVAEAMRDWSSDLNAAKRTKLKAQILAEDGLVQLDEMIHDPNVPPSSRIEAMKLMTRVAGVQEGEQNQAGSGFSVTINLGSDQPVVIDGGAGRNQSAEG